MERIYKSDTVIAANSADLIVKIRDNINITGWVVIDDQASASNYIVVYSNGYEKNNNRLPCYVKIRSNGSTYVAIDLWIYWDASSHVGHGFIGYGSPTTYSSYGACILTNSSNTNSISISGNKDFLYLDSTRTSNVKRYTCMVARLDNIMWDYIGVFQSTTLADTNAVAQLGSGESVNFKIGSEYRVVSPEGHIDKVVVTNKDISNDRLTLNFTHYTLISGTRIGSCPFPWVCKASSSKYIWALNTSIDYKYSSTNAVSITGQTSIAKAFNNQIYNNDWYNHNDISLFPYQYYESGYGTLGNSSYLQYCRVDSLNSGDIIGINELDSGSVSSATTTQLVDNNKSWAINSLSGTSVIITSGEQDEVTRYITANTATAITFDPEINPTISGGVTFTICEAFYMLDSVPFNYSAIKVL